VRRNVIPLDCRMEIREYLSTDHDSVVSLWNCVFPNSTACSPSQRGTMSRVVRSIAKLPPNIEPLLARTLFAIDAEYVTDEMVIQKDADIACIPPVSGG